MPQVHPERFLARSRQPYRHNRKVVRILQMMHVPYSSLWQFVIPRLLRHAVQDALCVAEVHTRCMPDMSLTQQVVMKATGKEALTCNRTGAIERTVVRRHRWRAARLRGLLLHHPHLRVRLRARFLRHDRFRAWWRR